MNVVDPQTEHARLRWRCRRGMQELDTLLLRWLERDWPEASPARRRTFESLLDTEDDRLWAWVIGREQPTDVDLAALVEQLHEGSSG